MDWGENTLFRPARLPQSFLEQITQKMIKWAAPANTSNWKGNQWRTEEDSNPRPLDS